VIDFARNGILRSSRVISAPASRSAGSRSAAKCHHRGELFPRRPPADKVALVVTGVAVAAVAVLSG